MTNSSKAFILMAFAPEFDAIYSEIIKPSLEEAGYSVTKADSFFDQQNILKDIIRGITTANLIVAELTTNNPNVFYELGICHGLNIPTILLAQSINEVPFDLRSYRILTYNTDFREIPKLKAALKEIGEKHIRGEILFGNPVVDFSPKDSEISEKILGQISEEVENIGDLEEKGILDFLVEGEESGNKLGEIFTMLTEETEKIASRINKHAANINLVTNNPKPGSAKQYHQIILLTASDMNTFSRRVENLLPSLEKEIEALIESFSNYILMIEPNTEQEKEQFFNFQKMIEVLYETANESKGSLSGFRDTTNDLINHNISKDLNRACRKQAQALDGVIANIDRVESFCLKTSEIIKNKLSNNINEIRE